MNNVISELINPKILDLKAYHVPPAEGFIKLDAMENPYQWNNALQQQWLKALELVSINRYPDPSGQKIKKMLRQTMQIPDSAEIILGNGSDELIQMLCLAIGGKNHTLLAVEPSFVMYKMLATVTGLNYVSIPLQADDFTLNLDLFLQAIEEHQPALIFLAYPNNPTGNAFQHIDLERILKIAKGIVVIDEAYCAFAEDSFISDIPRYPNLLVMRTLSKVGLAGLRLGMLAGSSEWLNEIEKTRLPYNINVLTQATVEFALQHYEVLLEQTAQIKIDREMVFEVLSSLKNVKVYPSEANFILFRVENAILVFNALKDHKILIKNLHGSHPLLENCLRVTIGTPEENQAFLSTLSEILK
jgi:histidinol-phosphate aminotransferase